jgi:hypothetical protein
MLMKEISSSARTSSGNLCFFIWTIDEYEFNNNVFFFL